MRHLFLALVLCACAFASQATLPSAPAFHYHAQIWGTKKGLEQTTVLAVVQGPDNFIWLGTQDGLFRFDGVHFKAFHLSDFPELQSNYITSLRVRGQQLWVGTLKGVSVYERGQFTSRAQYGLTGEVYALALAPDRTVLAAGEKGLFRIDADGASAVDGYKPSSACTVLADANGTWVGTTGGVLKRTSPEDDFTFVPFPNTKTTGSVCTLDKWRGQVWAGSSNGVYRLTGQSMTSAALNGKFVRKLFAGPRGRLWIGTDHGLYRLNADRELQDFRLVSELGPAWVHSLAADSEGNIWIGTALKGIVRLMNNHLATLSDAAGFDAGAAWSLIQGPDGRIWIGSDEGVYAFVNGRFEPRFDTKKLPASLVTTFFVNHDRLWIGTLKGLAIAENGHLIALPPALQKLPRDVIFSLTRSSDGGVWIGTKKGLFRYENGQLEHFGKKQGLNPKEIRTARQYGDTVWLATDKGAWVGRDGRFHKVGSVPEGDSRQFNGIYRTHDGAVWFGRQNAGLARVDKGELTLYGYADGLPHGLTLDLTGDGEGSLWVTVHNGIYRLRLEDVERFDSGAIQTLPTREYGDAGLLNVGCNGGGATSVLLDNDENLWCPAPRGLVVLDTNHLPFNAVPPPAAIEKISSGDDHYSFESGALTLPAGAGRLHVKYTGLSFITPTEVTFKYRLVGFDENWINAGTRRDAFYTNLPPGQYAFKVKARNDDGIVSRKAASVAIDIEPFYYQTAWFRALAAVVALLAMYGFYRWRMRFTRKRRAALEAIVQRRTGELREANERLLQVSVTDSLTGLKNRRYLVEHIAHDVARTRRDHQGASAGANSDIVFFMLDIDNFKSVNDTYGHQVGDRLLCAVAEILTAQMRQSDDVIRWGGEEFLVVAHQTERSRAEMMAERLRRVLDRRYDLGHSISIARSCSVGFCSFPLVAGHTERPDWEGVVTLADMALYRAKRAGRNAWAGLRATESTDPERVLADARVDLDRMIELGRLDLIHSGASVASA